MGLFDKKSPTATIPPENGPNKFDSSGLSSTPSAPHYEAPPTTKPDQPLYAAPTQIEAPGTITKTYGKTMPADGVMSIPPLNNATREQQQDWASKTKITQGVVPLQKNPLYEPLQQQPDYTEPHTGPAKPPLPSHVDDLKRNQGQGNVPVR